MDKLVNLLFISFAAIATIFNLFFRINTVGFALTVFYYPPVLVSFIGGACFIAAHFLPRPIRQVMQLVFLLFIASVNILDDYDSTFGLGFGLITIYLGYKYRIIRQKLLVIAGFVVLYLSLLIIISVHSHGESLNSSVLTISYLLFFYTIFFIGESRWAKRLAQSREAFLQSRSVLAEKEQLLAQTLEEVEGKRLDLKELRFTQKEIEVGRALVRTKTVDKQIAYELNISLNTLRNHFKSMRQKTNTETKQQLIDAIRWYYVGETQDSEELVTRN